MKFLTIILYSISILSANTLQEYINKAKPYSLLRLSKGLYIIIDVTTNQPFDKKEQITI